MSPTCSHAKLPNELLAISWGIWGNKDSTRFLIKMDIAVFFLVHHSALSRRKAWSDYSFKCFITKFPASAISHSGWGEFSPERNEAVVTNNSPLTEESGQASHDSRFFIGKIVRFFNSREIFPRYDARGSDLPVVGIPSSLGELQQFLGRTIERHKRPFHWHSPSSVIIVPYIPPSR